MSPDKIAIDRAVVEQTLHILIADIVPTTEYELAVEALRAALDQPAAPPCPYPCGWQKLHELAVKDGAFLTQMAEGEPLSEAHKNTAMVMVSRFIDVCRAMLNAAPEATGQQTRDEIIGAIRQRLATLHAQLDEVMGACARDEALAAQKEQP